MTLAECFPIWEKLTPEQQNRLAAAAVPKKASKGTVLHNGSADCLGLLVVGDGQLRALILSPEGREITLYRLFSRDICLFSAACILRSIQFDVTIQVEKDTQLWIIPPGLFKELADSSLAISSYVNELISSRFSEVMWRMEQVLWQSFDRRLAAFLTEESTLEGSPVLHLTHERIASHLGTAREVVTRMLRDFQAEGMVRLTRGTVELTDPERLRRLGGE